MLWEINSWELLEDPKLEKHPPAVTADLFGKRGCIPIICCLLSALLIWACQFSSRSTQRLIEPPPPPQRDIWVPRWYAEMPHLPGCRLAYAHSGVYIKADRQKQALVKNGAANLAKSSSVALEVGWAGSQKSSHSQTAAYIREKAWEAQAESIKKSIEILKEFRLEKSMLALVGICPGGADMKHLAATLDDTLVNVSSKQPPGWVSNPLESAGQLFGVGTAAGRTTAARAWQEAERQARAALAMRLAAQYQVLEKHLDQNQQVYTQVISETHAKLTLQNLQTIRHAYSHNGKVFYALVRIPATSRK